MYLPSSEGKSASVISTEERLNKGNSFISRKIVNSSTGFEERVDYLTLSPMFNLTHKLMEFTQSVISTEKEFSGEYFYELTL